jgi:hypothetical protein
MRIFILTLITFGSLLLFTAESPAHNALPSVQWCSSGTPVPVAEFKFYPAMLIQQRDAELDAAALAGEDGVFDHGVFDDDYDFGTKKAAAHCGQFQQQSNGDIGSVLPLIESPQTFLGADHHSSYSLDQGLIGTCVRCESSSTGRNR